MKWGGQRGMGAIGGNLGKKEGGDCSLPFSNQQQQRWGPCTEVKKVCHPNWPAIIPAAGDDEENRKFCQPAKSTKSPPSPLGPRRFTWVFGMIGRASLP